MFAVERFRSQHLDVVSPALVDPFDEAPGERRDALDAIAVAGIGEGDEEGVDLAVQLGERADVGMPRRKDRRGKPESVERHVFVLEKRRDVDGLLVQTGHHVVDGVVEFRLRGLDERVERPEPLGGEVGDGRPHEREADRSLRVEPFALDDFEPDQVGVGDVAEHDGQDAFLAVEFEMNVEFSSFHDGTLPCVEKHGCDEESRRKYIIP